MTPANQAGTSRVPYGIDRRPQPHGNDLEVLVPRTVGTWTREPFEPGTALSPDEDINATYTSGDDEITIGFSITDDAASAHTAIETTRDEAANSNIDISRAVYSIGTEPSYFKSERFMSWSRGQYFFYVDASDAAALDSFMQAFPY